MAKKQTTKEIIEPSIVLLMNGYVREIVWPKEYTLTQKAEFITTKLKELADYILESATELDNAETPEWDKIAERKVMVSVASCYGLLDEMKIVADPLSYGDRRCLKVCSE